MVTEITLLESIVGRVNSIETLESGEYSATEDGEQTPTKRLRLVEHEVLEAEVEILEFEFFLEELYRVHPLDELTSLKSYSPYKYTSLPSSSRNTFSESRITHPLSQYWF